MNGPTLGFLTPENVFFCAEWASFDADVVTLAVN